MKVACVDLGTLERNRIERQSRGTRLEVEHRSHVAVSVD